MQTYTQCKLRRLNTLQTAWIPSQFATAGRFLKIRGENGWQVESTGGTQTEDYRRGHERDYLIQRGASDI